MPISELCTRTLLAPRMASWTDEETLKLIELWGEDSIQAELEGCKRNKAVYEKISRDMVAAGYDRNAVQCRDKIKKLRAEYRKIKDNNNQTGRSRKTMKCFEKLDEILGHKPATKPQYVLDTSDESPVSLEQSASYSADISDGDTSPNEQKIKEKKEENQDSKDEKTVDLTKVQENRKKRKKTAREQTIEKAMDGIISAVTTMQKESNERFCEIEEKRMKLDEKMMELEHRRWRESQDREERQRREDREFRLQMMQLLSGRRAFPPPPPFFEYCNPSIPSENGPGTGSYEWPDQNKEDCD